MSDQAAGPILDALGVRLDLDEHQHLSEVVLVGKLINAEDGETALILTASDGTDWVAQLGLLAAGRAVVEQNVREA